MSERKAKITNRATKQWLATLNDYLKERKLGSFDDVKTEDWPQVLTDFYFSLQKQPKKKKDSKSKLSLSKNKAEVGDIEDNHYKNSSLKSGCAAFNCHFKAKLGVDILSNELCIKANEAFTTVTKKGKVDG